MVSVAKFMANLIFKHCLTLICYMKTADLSKTAFPVIKQIMTTVVKLMTHYIYQIHNRNTTFYLSEITSNISHYRKNP